MSVHRFLALVFLSLALLNCHHHRRPIIVEERGEPACREARWHEGHYDGRGRWHKGHWHCPGVVIIEED
jgi:hypothetical protein